MATYTYPTNAELQLIAQDKMPALQADRPAFQILPIVNHDTSLVMWEQMDNYIGLQQVRGLNGQPANVKPVGSKLFQSVPGVYGEFSLVDELLLVERRRLGGFNVPVSVDDLVMQRQDQLLGRRLDRIEQIIWTLLSTGTFSVAGPNGAILHTDNYTTQTYTAGVTWATVATATPLANFRAVQLLGRGRSAVFDAGAKAYMNRVTANSLLSNTNANDLAGRRTAGLASVMSIGDTNQVLLGEGLPQLVVEDSGYFNDSSTFVPFIPNNKVVVVGRRPAGQTIGEYQMVRNANNDNMAPGPYMKIVDNGEDHVPRSIEVHDGHSGGPAIFFPSAIVLMTV
jgi:hypothetical protein